MLNFEQDFTAVNALTLCLTGVERELILVYFQQRAKDLHVTHLTSYSTESDYGDETTLSVEFAHPILWSWLDTELKTLKTYVNSQVPRGLTYRLLSVGYVDAVQMLILKPACLPAVTEIVSV